MEPCIALKALRTTMGWSRIEMSSFLGVSRKAVESYEQGWRNIPNRVWKQLLTVAAIQNDYSRAARPCWELTDCPETTRHECFSGHAMKGQFCWMTATRCCRQKVLRSHDPQGDFLICLNCPVVKQFLKVEIPGEPADA